MALVDVKLETFVSEPDALTTRPSPCNENRINLNIKLGLQLTPEG